MAARVPRVHKIASSIGVGGVPYINLVNGGWAGLR